MRGKEGEGGRKVKGRKVRGEGVQGEGGGR